MEVAEMILSVVVSILSAALTCWLWQRFQLGHKGESSGNIDSSTCSGRLETDSTRVEKTRFEQAPPGGSSECSGGDNKLRDETGMTMKERFYLFLEKGFCPELEQGVKDPLYKRYGGTLGKAVDNGKDSDASDDGMKAGEEVNGLEKMIRLAKSTGGKCPFSFDQSAATKDKNEQCPFSYGLVEGADSEEEADVPAVHRTNTNCPLNSKSQANLPEADDKQTKQDEQEAQILEEQMKVISQLLASQEGDAQDTAELKSQLKLYMQ